MRKPVLKPLSKIFLALTISFMLVLTVYVFLNYYKIEHELLAFVKDYGLFAILLISFFTDVLFQPIGPDVAVIGGVLLYKEFFCSVFFASLGSVLASFLSYFFGRMFRSYGMHKLNSSAKYHKWRRIHARYGLISLSIGALSPVPYVPMCWIAGLFNVKMYKFILFGIVPRVIRFATLGMIAHYVNMSIS
ncbi:MAG: DedA family protein [Flexistipes sinusarabici]|uniref:DedA family protein n=1 Tax=Flexistipes sinusarabici TaxID=2352 RepID=A0A5D0MLR7_FLESI|nr:VTT domain-containing protein [Flexistipes sinusarabici]TYB32895.1 MAG: DedA family protein [Flexistipes sinusarabici]